MEVIDWRRCVCGPCEAMGAEWRGLMQGEEWRRWLQEGRDGRRQRHRATSSRRRGKRRRQWELLALLLVAAVCTFDDGIHGFKNESVATTNTTTTTTSTTTQPPPQPAIDDYIYGMTYLRDEILAYRGDSVDSVSLQTDRKLDDEKNFIVIKKEKKTAKNEKADIGVVASNEHRAYPGALLLANQRFMDNSPDMLAIDRAPLTYTVNLPGLTKEGNFKIKPTFAEYQAAKENTLKIWFDKFSKNHSVVANFQSDLSVAYSKELLSVKFGLEFKNNKIEANIDFRSMINQEKLIMIYQFKQIFYTVSVEPTKKPSELFGPGVTIADVKQRTDSNNPPVMVDSVSYGRTIYVKLETSSTEAITALTAKANIFDLSATAENELKECLKNLNIQVFVLGGSSEQIRLINTQSFKQVNDILVKYARFSRENLGYPISYSTQFIKDNSRAVVHMSTDYIETTREIHKKGIIKIKHTGWFTMQWAVTWKEISYDEYRDIVVKEGAWEKNWDDLTAPFEREIELPGNAQDIRVIAKECTGLAWEWWRTVIDRSGIPLIENREFHVWGTTLSPDYSIFPEP